MKLLTDNVGWAATNTKLFWTTDSGASWRDITPKLGHRTQMVSSVFFLDTSTGWVVLKCADGKSPLLDDVCFEFASTADGGESWSVAHPKITNPGIDRSNVDDGVGTYSGTAFLQFADSQHGWAILKKAYNTARSVGAMLHTVDGGKTWTQLPGAPPIAEPFYFVNASTGWIAGGPDLELYVTHDAGSSWRSVQLGLPKGVAPDLSPVYNLPVFENDKAGHLSVAYESNTTPNTTVALFRTLDGGNTWLSTAALSELPNAQPWVAYPAAVVGEELLVPTLSKNRLTLSRSREGAGAVFQSAKVSVRASSVDGLSFAARDRGWVLATYWILSTRDGGITWTDVTPVPQETIPPLASNENAHSAGVPADRPNPSAAAGSNAPSEHLGFDTWPTPPLTTMQAWSNSSPYYDVYIYLYGSPNKSTNKSLYPSTQWLSTVETTYGWGVIPTWFGLQSTCVNDKNGITQFISTDPATAGTQGLQQADLAVAADQALGISSGIIYVDIESYTVDHSTCSLAVQAYVNGFVTEMHSAHGGYVAGVYAPPADINADIAISAVAQPDTIWITKYSPLLVTTWNLGIKDTLWPYSQRMHQFAANKSATFGGAGLKIDPDIDNGPVLNANAVAKSYTYTAATIDCAGTISTIPTAMNDMNGTTFINGPGQMGTVIGTYQASIGGPTTAFKNSGGSCTTLNIFSSNNAEPFGINNLGQIVGFFEDANGQFHGFQLNPGKSPTQIDYPGATATYLYGINDAGQIVGVAYSPSTFYYQTFIYYGGKFYPLGISGGGTFEYTLGYSINGDATVAGRYYYNGLGEDYEESAVPPSWAGSPLALTPGGSANTVAHGINSNNELAGFYSSTACNDKSFQCAFVWTGGFTLDILQFGSTANVAYGMNDFAEAIGPYTDSNTGYSHGLLWSHQ